MFIKGRGGATANHCMSLRCPKVSVVNATMSNVQILHDIVGFFTAVHSRVTEYTILSVCIVKRS